MWITQVSGLDCSPFDMFHTKVFNSGFNIYAVDYECLWIDMDSSLKQVPKLKPSATSEQPSWSDHDYVIPHTQVASWILLSHVLRMKS